MWTASQVFLKDVLEQLKASHDEITSLREQNEKLLAELKALTEKAARWQKRAQTLEDEMSDLEERLRRETKSGPNK